MKVRIVKFNDKTKIFGNRYYGEAFYVPSYAEEELWSGVTPLCRTKLGAYLRLLRWNKKRKLKDEVILKEFELK